MRWLIAALAFGGCIGIGFGYHLAEEIVWPLFWASWLFGITIAYFHRAFVSGRRTIIVQGWATFWEAVSDLLWKSFVRGSLVGAALFAGIVFVNCQFTQGPMVRVDGVVVDKAWRSTRSGRSYYLVVRDEDNGYTFKCAVGSTPYDLTHINARWSFALRHGVFGWPFRVE